MKVKYEDLLDVATDDVTEWFARCETARECEQLARDMRDQLDIVARLRATSLAKRADVGCEPPTALLEEVPVEPEGGEPGRATALREVGGCRRWAACGDPEEDWWAEVDDAGRRLPGDWEYDRDGGVVVCSLVPV